VGHFLIRYNNANFVYNIEEYVFSDFYIKLINTILYYLNPL